MSPKEKLKEEMRMLTRRRKSGMEAFSLLMAMDATMAFTSYILAFAPGSTLDFHRFGTLFVRKKLLSRIFTYSLFFSALIVLYLLVLSWVTVVSVTPFYIRLKITFNNCLLKFLIFIHNCLIFSYVIVLLATAPSFGPTFCCNYTAKGVVLVSFSALGTGRLVGWAVASILILVYLLHLSGRCTPTWKRRSQPSLESHDSIRSIPQTRNFTVSSNTGATSSRHATETTGEIGQVTQKSKREDLSSEKPGTTGHAITEPVNSLTGENTPTNTSKSPPIVELAGDTNARDEESTKGHTRTSTSDSVSQAQSVSTVLTEDGMNDEKVGESLEFLKVCKIGPDVENKFMPIFPSLGGCQRESPPFPGILHILAYLRHRRRVAYISQQLCVRH